MKNFITNSDAENLKKRLVELINKSEELKFLVGFFHFSGIRELYSELKQNPKVVLKVLVGLNVDRHNYQLIEYADSDDQSGNLSNEEISQRFFSSLKKSINTEKSDTQEFYEQVKFFLKLIKDGRLIIRKTFKPNHAKLYIFKLQSGQVRNTLFITGSSNLTSSGLTTQEEFNVEISDYGFENAEKYFDSLWDEAVKITENDARKKRLIEIVEKETLVKKIIPFEAFVLTLKIYLDSFKKKEIGQSLIKTLEKNGYTLYKYQLDAIRQALAIIEKNNGVILADVVGLGKTIIACSVAKELRKRGVIICPPGLRGDPRKKNSGWNMYKEQFGLHDWEVWSLGDLEKLQKSTAKDIEVVIVDEAHRFRNQDTKNYEYLKNICRGKQVILLTATPFNNRPGDILSLLKLFIIPKKSPITLENSLVARFKSFKGAFDKLGYIKKHWNSTNEQKRKKAYDSYEAFFGEKFNAPAALKKVKQRSRYLAKQIRDVIEPVTIRRNRLDLEESPYYKKEVQNLSKVADPKEWFFELTKEQSELYDQVINTYFGDPDEGGKFKGAIYRPFEYETSREKIAGEKLNEKENFEFIQQRNLYDFMRRLLVKRFESSFGSFEQSLKNFKHITESVLKFIEKTGRYILDRSLLERIYDKDPEEIEQYLKDYTEKINAGQYPKNHKIYKLSDFEYREKFLADIQSDLNLFKEILKSLHDFDLVKNDPKTKCLIQNLKFQLKKDPSRKIVIFSEYLDTVKYLEPRLKKVFGNKLLTIAGDLTAQKLSALNKNFDASFPEQENQHSILLSTDKISEGFNLNRAGMVINYDIPWNPVRVIQRVGRINRISKKIFDELYIINFFPTELGAELVQSREIASNKMFLIHNTLGEDAKIFDPDEEPTPAKLYNRIQQNPDKLEEVSFYTKALKEFEKIKKSHPDLISQVDKFPPRVKVAKKAKENELLVFLKKGRLYIQGAKYAENNRYNFYQPTFEEVFEKISCKPQEKPLELSGQFWGVYEQIKNFRDYRIGPPSEQSLEQQAINNLRAFIYHRHEEEIIKVKDFLRTLLEDITDYGTLPDYTLRRIANLESSSKEKLKKSLKEIEALKDELGEDYLEREKARQKELAKEIIVAIENRKL
ncbi:MAG: helicase [Candidatus Schekmanbacteria bacterium]|nr:MAG: helicase [Candidatus Schekmanbacteria bacterium]